MIRYNLSYSPLPALYGISQGDEIPDEINELLSGIWKDPNYMP
jgi:hypothetical protein